MTRARRLPVAAALLALAGCGGSPPAPQNASPENSAPAPAPVTLVLPDNFSVFATVAADTGARERGLMGVSQVPPGQGMLFVFPQPMPVRFWMKNCLTPIDMVFMDESGRVLHSENAAPICAADPCPLYGPPGDAPVQFVLELGPGEAARHGLKPGTTLPLPEKTRLLAVAR